MPEHDPQDYNPYAISEGTYPEDDLDEVAAAIRALPDELRSIYAAYDLVGDQYGLERSELERIEYCLAVARIRYYAPVEDQAATRQHYASNGYPQNRNYWLERGVWTVEDTVKLFSRCEDTTVTHEPDFNPRYSPEREIRELWGGCNDARPFGDVLQLLWVEAKLQWPYWLRLVRYIEAQQLDSVDVTTAFRAHHYPQAVATLETFNKLVLDGQNHLRQWLADNPTAAPNKSMGVIREFLIAKHHPLAIGWDYMNARVAANDTGKVLKTLCLLIDVTGGKGNQGTTIRKMLT